MSKNQGWIGVAIIIATAILGIFKGLKDSGYDED
jgi:hypothetical protein